MNHQKVGVEEKKLDDNDKKFIKDIKNEKGSTLLRKYEIYFDKQELKNRNRFMRNAIRDFKYSLRVCFRFQGEEM